MATDSDDTTPKNAGLRTNFTLTGLEPYTLYDVAVQAFTGAGGGEKSSVKVKTDESGEPWRMIGEGVGMEGLQFFLKRRGR